MFFTQELKKLEVAFNSSLAVMMVGSGFIGCIGLSYLEIQGEIFVKAKSFYQNAYQDLALTLIAACAFSGALLITSQFFDLQFKNRFLIKKFI